MLRGGLERENYQVALAPNGEVALRNAARLQPYLVLLDITMPEMDDYEVCRHLKADPITADIPVVFITARDLKNIVKRALSESVGGAITLQHVHFQAAQRPTQLPTAPATNDDRSQLPLDIDEAIACAERWVVQRALAESDGNVSAATRLLNTNRNRIYRILGQQEKDKPT